MTLLDRPSLTEEPPPGGGVVDAAEPVTVHESTRTGVPPLRQYVRETWERRPFIWHLARTSLKAENYDTAAGQVWIILNPLFMAAVYLLVRSIFRGPSEDRGDVIDHIVMGVFFFKFASASLSLGATSITSQRQLVLNTGFPRIIFPLASAVQAVIEFLPTLVVWLALHWYLDQPFSVYLVYVPFLVATLVVFNVGLSLFFAPLCVIYTDIKALVPYISKTWLFTTPVMYSVSLVEENVPHLMKWMYVNPLFPWFAALEDIGDGVAPSSTHLLLTLAWSFGFLVLGTYVFLRKERFFARRL